MTESFAKDMLALEDLIKALPASQAGSAALTALNSLLATAKSNATVLQTKVAATQAAHKAVDADRSWLSTEMEKKLNGLRASDLGGSRSLLEQVVFLNEDGDLTGTNAGNGYRRFVKSLRQSLGAGKTSQRDQLVATLTTAAADAGTAAHSFCDHLKTPDPSVSGKYLIASALDALLPVAMANGLSADSLATLAQLRKAITSAGGGAPGSSYWPSGYVYSSSSSSSPPP